jgi:hypothetical protein
MIAKRYFRGPEAAELTMIIRWCMGVRQFGARLGIMGQGWQTG